MALTLELSLTYTCLFSSLDSVNYIKLIIKIFLFSDIHLINQIIVPGLYVFLLLLAAKKKKCILLNFALLVYTFH